MSATKHTFLLDEHEEAFIEAQLKSGGYADASDVVRTALLLLEDQQAELERLEADHDDLREKIMVGMKDIEEGRYRDYGSAGEIKQDIIARAKALR